MNETCFHFDGRNGEEAIRACFGVLQNMKKKWGMVILDDPGENSGRE